MHNILFILTRDREKGHKYENIPFYFFGIESLRIIISKKIK